MQGGAPIIGVTFPYIKIGLVKASTPLVCHSHFLDLEGYEKLLARFHDEARAKFFVNEITKALLVVREQLQKKLHDVYKEIGIWENYPHVSNIEHVRTIWNEDEASPEPQFRIWFNTAQAQVWNKYRDLGDYGNDHPHISLYWTENFDMEIGDPYFGDIRQTRTFKRKAQEPTAQEPKAHEPKASEPKASEPTTNEKAVKAHKKMEKLISNIPHWKCGTMEVVPPPAQEAMDIIPCSDEDNEPNAEPKPEPKPAPKPEPKPTGKRVFVKHDRPSQVAQKKRESPSYSQRRAALKKVVNNVVKEADNALPKK